MINALIALDLNAFIGAVLQDVFILVFSIIAAIVLWYNTYFKLSDDAIFIKSGVFVHNARIYTKQSISVIDIQRPLYYRFFSASRVTLYFNNHALPKKVTFVLPKKTADELSTSFMPLRKENSIFAPLGFERFVLTLLSANIITTALFLYYTVQTISNFSGRDVIEVTQAAQENFWRIERILEQFLPTGIAFLTAVIFGIASVAILNSFFTTGGLRVCRSGGVIFCECGIFSKTERRIRIKNITSCDVRVTPTSRILGRYAVYITAGSFKKSDFPVMIIKKEKPHSVQILIEDYSTPTAQMCDTKHRSLFEFLYKPIIFIAITTTIFVFTCTHLPMSAPAFFALVILAFGTLLTSLQGFKKEGVCTNKNRTLSLYYTRLFTLHKVCIFSSGAMYTLLKKPYIGAKKYVTFYSRLPSGKTYKARGVPLNSAGRVRFVE